LIHKKPISQGYFIAFISAVVLSFTGILISIITKEYAMPAIILAFWRDIMIAGCLFPILLVVKPKLLNVKRQNIAFLLVFGIVIAIFNVLWTLSVAISGASIATVLVYSSGAFTAILGFLFLRENLGWPKIVAIVISFTGCLFVANALNLTEWNTNPLGIILGILSGVLYAIYSLLGRKASQRDLNPWTTLFYSFLFAAVILLMLNLLPIDFLPVAKNPQALFLLGAQWRGWLLLLLLAAGPSLLGFGLYNVSLGFLPSSTANLILTFEPVMTGIAAYLLLGERLTSVQILGSGLILVALIVLRTNSEKPSLSTLSA
jgi:drug/metabolite transporter (DMT)-like permease